MTPKEAIARRRDPWLEPTRDNTPVCVAHRGRPGPTTGGRVCILMLDETTVRHRIWSGRDTVAAPPLHPLCLRFRMEIARGRPSGFLAPCPWPAGLLTVVQPPLSCRGPVRCRLGLIRGTVFAGGACSAGRASPRTYAPGPHCLCTPI